MFIRAPEPSAETQEMDEATVRAQGFVMNLNRAWAWRPDVFGRFAGLRSRLLEASTFTRREQAVIVCATAATREDAYCALAWGRTLAQEAGVDCAAAVITGDDDAGLSARDRALAAWARKVAANPNATTAQDVEVLRAAGLSDREIFEATAFIAFRLAFSTVNAALGVAPDRQLVEALPSEVRDVVNFGRAPAAG